MQSLKHQQSEPKNQNGAFDIGAYEFSANAPVQILTTSLPNGIRGRFYNQTLQASGGTGAFVWSVSNGNLPPGMWFDSATGKIYGKAALKGIWNFTITVEDDQNQTATQNFMINVKL